MLLVLDVGNTEVTLGLFREAALARQWRLTTRERTPDEWSNAVAGCLSGAGLSAGAVRAVCLTSVAPAATRALREGMAALTGADTALVDASTAGLPVRLDVDDPRTVGGDRIVNTLAAAALHPGDLVVVDFGTATTYDCITADGRFIGGAIAPGFRTSAEELTRKAAKLPATELVVPARVIGRRTEECIQAGVLYGAADAAEGMVRRIRAEWPGGGTPRAIATGGLAPLVAPLVPSIEVVVPDLTLQGLRLAAGHLGLAW